MKERLIERACRRFVAVAIILPALLAIGCGSGVLEPGDTISSHEEARAKWSGNDFENYSYEFRWQCYCARNVEWARVQVKDNEVVRVTDIASGEAFGPEQDWVLNGYETIDGLFAIIDDARGRDTNTTSYMATYDAVYGYPVDVDIDWIIGADDDELSFEIRKVEIE